MSKPTSITRIFPKHLFWDVKVDQLEPERDQDLIISRAFYMTNEKSFEDDISRLEMFYSNDEIVQNLKTTKERICNRVCELVARRYHIPLFHRYSHR